MSHWWSHRIVRVAALLAGLTVLGTVGYMVVERWPFADALFMTVAILSTVGLGEPHPLSPDGRIFTVALIVTGVSVAAYLVTSLGEYVTGGVLTGVFRRRRLQHAIAHLSDHYIVCGYGRVGRQVVADLRRRGVSVVVVERHPAPTDEVEGLFIVTGDATEDEVLTRAGVMRARGLVAATGTDATNLVVALSARALSSRLVIVARASDSAVEAKLMRAGATHVISPHAIGGQRIMSELLSPGVTAFLDAVLHAEQLDLWLELATVAPASVLAGQTLGDALPPSRRAVNLVALRRAADKDFVTNPPLEACLAVGDTLVALGPAAAMRHLASRAEGAMGRGAHSSGARRVRKPERLR